MIRTSTPGKIKVAAAVLLVFILAGCAEGPVTEGKFRSGERITVPSTESITGDLYVTGGTITVDASVGGDLTTCGGTVTVNGAVGGNLLACGGQLVVNGGVKGDVTAAGGQISVSGPVGGDVRVGAGTLVVSGPVGEDVVVGAGELEVQQGATIGGDLVFGTGSANVAGAVTGNIIGQTERYNRSGTVEGTEEVRITAAEEEERPGKISPELAWLLDRLRTLAVLLLLGGLMMWLRPGWLDGLAERILQRPVASVGWGLLTWVGVPFAVLVFTVGWIILAALFGLVTLGSLVAAIVTTGLLADALIMLAFVLAAVFLTWVVVGFAVGRLSVVRLAAGTAVNRFLVLAIGIVILVVLSSIPVVGAIVTVLVGLLGMGALGWAVYDMIRGWGRGTPPHEHEGMAGETSGH